MRERYVKGFGLFSEEYNSTEVYVRSTNVNRTIESAISHLVGLYGPGSQMMSVY